MKCRSTLALSTEAVTAVPGHSAAASRVFASEWTTFEKERLTQTRLSRRFAAAFMVCILLPVVAPAQVSLFTQGPGLSPEDNLLLFESIARLNAAKPARVGNSEAWSNPQTNDSGTNTVLRVFRSGGMACHLVQHHIVAGGAGRDCRLTWCLTPSGEWKIKA